MDERLKSVIAHFEEEKQWLLRQIEDYVKVWEYECAHFHSRALFRLNGRLRTLHQFQDRLYVRKERLRELIDMYEKLLQSTILTLERDVYLRELREHKAALAQLNEQIEPPDSSGNERAFENTLGDLLAGKYNSFNLILDKKQRLLFQISYSRKTLTTRIPFIKRHIKNETFSDRDLRVLNTLGFRTTRGRTKLVLQLQGTKEEIADEIKWRLAKIVYELLYYRTGEMESYIEFNAKKGR